MTHGEFTGVTFNNLDWPGTDFEVIRVSVVNSAEIVLNILHKAHIFVQTWLHDVPVFAITNPSVCLSLKTALNDIFLAGITKQTIEQ